MIYLDYNATTPIDPAVAEAMLPYLYGDFGNPSSSHRLGSSAKQALEHARGQVAGMLHAESSEIVFTSGGSESNNMAIKGAALTFKPKGRHIITTVIEHPSVLNPCRFLEKNGYRVTYLPVDRYGAVDLDELERAFTPETILVTVMHSNNETGTLQPIRDIARLCRSRGVFFHTDASQSAGKVPLNVQELGVDALTLAGHKVYAPKGIGALYLAGGQRLEPLIHGAGHEQGRRAGTENVLLAAGLGAACELAARTDSAPVGELAAYFYGELQRRYGGRLQLNGHPEQRLPNTLNLSILGTDGQQLLGSLQEVAASTGSACHSGTTEMSPVLSAMGVSEPAGRAAIRFSLGRYTTREEIDGVLSQLDTVLTAGQQRSLGVTE
ncbi:cysteine desulfurase family protein [Paenibacillus sp. CN-4]|uniref:cysteine desulfurase family protein n=1 Tax=Paenibacillus nanchangensis TaxID=3348343 RepID=UPI00397B02B0